MISTVDWIVSTCYSSDSVLWVLPTQGSNAEGYAKPCSLCVKTKQVQPEQTDVDYCNDDVACQRGFVLVVLLWWCIAV